MKHRSDTTILEVCRLTIWHGMELGHVLWRELNFTRRHSILRVWGSFSCTRTQHTHKTTSRWKDKGHTKAFRDSRNFVGGPGKPGAVRATLSLKKPKDHGAPPKFGGDLCESGRGLFCVLECKKEMYQKLLLLSIREHSDFVPRRK